MRGRTKTELTNASAASPRVGCDLCAVSPPFTPRPNPSNSFDKASIFSFVVDDSYPIIRRMSHPWEMILPSGQCAYITGWFVSHEPWS